MKTSLVAVVLAVSAMAVGQAAAPQSPAQPAPAQQSQPQPQTQQPQAAPAQQQPPAPQQKKEIKDPAEYNAYVGAVQQSDAAAKISGLEAFLSQYHQPVIPYDLKIGFGLVQLTLLILFLAKSGRKHG